MTLEPVVTDRAEHGDSHFAAIERALRPTRDTDTLHPLWTGKRADGGAVRVETGSGAAATILRCADVSSIHLAFDGFAVARLDDWAGRWAALHLLFRVRDRWRIAGSATVSAASRSGVAPFRPTDDERGVLDVLASYYSAVRDGDPGMIERIFSPAWEMKNHEGDVLVREDKPTFIARIAKGPLPGYDDDRLISDVQVIHGALAYVRVDRPSRPSTTVFLFMREGDAWRIVDKAWMDGLA